MLDVCDGSSFPGFVGFPNRFGDAMVVEMSLGGSLLRRRWRVLKWWWANKSWGYIMLLCCDVKSGDSFGEPLEDLLGFRLLGGLRCLAFFSVVLAILFGGCWQLFRGVLDVTRIVMIYD